MIVAVMGLPGSGKSYFAEKLAEKLHARYVSSDITRQRLFANREYSPSEKKRVYEEMISEMKAAVQHKEPLVLDATFYREDIRKQFTETASRPIQFIEVRADEALIKERLEKKRQHSEADYTVYLKIKAAFEPLAGEHLVLESTQQNIEEMLKRAITYLHPTHE